MLICDQCKYIVSTVINSDRIRSFPAFTVGAGLVAFASALTTGVFLLVPAALFGGAILDHRRCSLCDREIFPEDTYQVLEENSDSKGRLFYRQVRDKPQPDVLADQQIPGHIPWAMNASRQPFCQDHSAPIVSNESNPVDLIFDEDRQCFVPRDCEAESVWMDIAGQDPEHDVLDPFVGIDTVGADDSTSQTDSGIDSGSSDTADSGGADGGSEGEGGSGGEL